ncbi:hypothetical protein J7T55_000610 [Diaporthe amygdali]|uniref:uncharacterized protein n=1 Tax=Phomopsis amygdali TaxID=1214568 RepID=UPI0022FEF21E|nr:uncharacterized protein J7T55_000610 [Diaporthe amygdali]KAJ0110178.1 hypothetical protein J7T55_000610 [Diaporthe amygdali]
MVAIIRLGLVLLASALTAQACTYCQCKFQDNSHCCVYSDAAIGNLDCTEICSKAHRADGVSNSDGTAGTACNAGGNYECISFITAQGRTPCYKE